MSELGNQLNSQTLEQVLASTFNTVGGRVYPDLRSETGLLDFIAVVNAWRATHAQAYGGVIPDSGTAYAVTASSTDSPVDLVAPSNNEVVVVNAISVTNAGGAAPIPYQVKLGDTILAAGEALPALSTPVTLQYAVSVSKGQTLTITATSGTATDLTAHASGVKSCQWCGNMPRKAPGPNNGVTEHRLTLGDFERKQLVQAIDAYQTDKVLENVPNLMIGGAAVGAVALAAYIAYKVYDILPNPFEMTEEEKSAVKWVFSFGGIIGDIQKKEWRTFGVPQEAGDIDTMYAINTAHLDEQLEKAKSTIAYFQQLKGFKVPMVMIKANETAMQYRDIGNAKARQNLEEWKAFYIEKFQNQ